MKTYVAYNTGGLIPDTIQIGSLAISQPGNYYDPDKFISNGITWWSAPDLEIGHVIAYPVHDGTHPTPIDGLTSHVGFLGTANMENPHSETAFLNLIKQEFNQEFRDIGGAYMWLKSNGFWTNYNSPIVLENLLVNLDAGIINSYSGSGNTWVDLQGNNNGTLINGPTYNTQHSGSIRTDGYNDYIRVDRISGTGTSTQSFTYELWISPLDNNGNIMSMSSANPQTDWNMPPISAVSGKFKAKIWNNLQISATSNFTHGEWYQVVLVWDYPNRRQNLYVNSVLNATQGNITYLSSDVNNYIFLGQANPGADNAGAFNGDYGIVRLYKKALTPTEILNNYNANIARYT